LYLLRQNQPNENSNLYKTSKQKQKMETSSTTTTTAKIPSDMAVSVIIQKGFQDILLQTSIGLIVGTLTGIVLARGGNKHTMARKVYTGLGAGIGCGTAWTNTSIQLEELLTPSTSTKK
jgi:hypothetical protein